MIVRLISPLRAARLPAGGGTKSHCNDVHVCCPRRAAEIALGRGGGILSPRKTFAGALRSARSGGNRLNSSVERTTLSCL